jgi:hypothetical protein
MTDDSRTICKRCGFSNVPGDQFCGSCGAFLEWEGQAAPPAEANPGTPDAPGSPDAPPVEATTTASQAVWGAPYGDPLPTPPPAAWPDDEDDDRDDAPDDAYGAGDGLVRCPACGIANPAGRTFCQSCGTTLAAAPRVQEASHEQIAAAVAMTPEPEPLEGATNGRTGGRPNGKGGVPPWVLGIGVVGLLVGVAIVLAGVALRSPSPDTGATGSGAVPSSSAAAGESPGASGPAGSPSSPGTPVALVLTARASSSVDRPKFQPAMAVDGDPDTAWQEGKPQEKDQWIEVRFDPSRADTLIIRNGYQASQALFRGNRRLKDILVTVNGGKAIPVRLKDTMKAQEVDLGGVTGASKVRITIVSTYPGEQTSVAGSPFDDAAVSEISVLGVPGG